MQCEPAEEVNEQRSVCIGAFDHKVMLRSHNVMIKYLDSRARQPAPPLLLLRILILHFLETILHILVPMCHSAHLSTYATFT